MAGPKRSAGILLYRRSPAIEVLIAHPGGPFWARKDAGVWSIPKGELEEGEEPLDAAAREFGEELGLPVPVGPVADLGEVAQNRGKIVRAFAVEGDLDPDAIVPGTFELAWPPRSGRTMTVPEVDRVAWCSPDAARERLLAGQRPLIDRLEQLLAHGASGQLTAGPGPSGPLAS